MLTEEIDRHLRTTYTAARALGIKMGQPAHFTESGAEDFAESGNNLIRRYIRRYILFAINYNLIRIHFINGRKTITARGGILKTMEYGF